MKPPRRPALRRLIIAALLVLPGLWLAHRTVDSGWPVATPTDTPPAATVVGALTEHSGKTAATVFPGHAVLASQTTTRDGNERRVSLLRTTFKYPLIRIETEAPTTKAEAGTERLMVADHLIVHPRAGVSPTDFNRRLQALGFTIRRSIASTGGYLVAFPLTPEPAQAFEAALVRLQGSEDLVALAEPDYIVTTSALPAGEAALAGGQLWALHNTGRDNGLAGVDMDAPSGWDIIHDAPGIVVAVIDSGINLAHQDLTANLWINPGEIPDNGIDDDGNGVIDDAHGFNAYADNGSPDDDNGHGTHCAGIIGADGHNAAGLTGVAWHTQVMGVKFLSASGAGTTSDAIAAIDYAVAHGARVLNLSWGGAGHSISLRQALQRARDAGVIAVAAAGNDAANNDNRPVYPASYELNNIVVAASSDRRDQLSWFSNYGPTSVNLAAPGEDILSAWIDGPAGHKTLSGTSMAAAQVSGAMTLLAAHHTEDNHRQLINRLLGGAETIAGLPVARQSRINLHQALTTASAGPVNDAFAKAGHSALNGVTWHGQNHEATSEAGEPAHVAGGATRSVWYRWTAPHSGTATLIFTNDFAGRAAIYTGAELAALTPIASTLAGTLTFPVNEGVDYHLAVDGTGGAFNISLSIPPPNDDRADAILMEGDSWQTSGTNLGTTREPGETDHAAVPGGRSVWWRWTAPLDGPMRIDTDDSDFDTTLAVYDEAGSSAIIQGEQPDLVLVIDVSGSTGSGAQTSYIGDVNGDGRVNTILDAEIAAALALHQTLVESGRPARVAVVAFGDTASVLDMDPVAPGLQVFTAADADADANGVPDVTGVLRALRAGGNTNYTDALAKTADAFAAGQTAAGNGTMIFLSDGKPGDAGDFGATAHSLRASGHLLHAYGAGGGASLASLQLITPDALIFTNIAELIAVFNGAVAVNDDHGGRLTSEVNFSAKAGHTYLIAVDGYQAATGTIRLTGQYSQGLQIIAQPRDLSVERHAAAVFSVTARGVAPFNYQWFKNGQLMPDATDPTLRIDSADIADDGDYHVVVNNTFATATSRTATLDVIIREPVITREIRNQTVVAGTQVQFSAQVVGTAPFTYQWYHNGEIIEGATAADLVIPAASTANTGAYHVVITNDSGTTTSQTAFLSLADNPFAAWERRSPSFAPHGVLGVVYLNERFLVHGYNGLIAVSVDGHNWADARVPGTYFGENDNRNVTIKTVAWLNGHYVALGQSTSGTYSLHSSIDGIVWESLPNPHRISTLDYLDGLYVGAGIHATGRPTYYASADLQDWIAVGQFGYERVPLLASGATWKYLPAITSYPSGWTGIGFDDSAWASGPAPLGFGNNGETTTVPTGNTTLFRITVPSPKTYNNARIVGRLLVDDGALIYFNGGITHRQNMSVDWPSANQRAATDIAGATESTYVEFSGLYTQSVQASNVFAVQVHQSVADPADMVFDLEADLELNYSSLGPVAGNGRMVVMRGDGKTFTSTDGLDWTRHDNTGLDNAASGQFVTPTRLRFINGRFLAWTATGKRLYSSTDGISWTLQTGNLQPDNFDWDGQTYYYIGSTVRTSADAATWNFRMLPSTYGTDLKPDAGVYGNGVYVLVNGEGKSATVSQLADITGSLMSYSRSQGRRLRILNGSLVSIADHSAVDSRTWMSNDGASWKPVLTAGTDLSYGHDTYLRFALNTPLLGYDLSTPSLTSEGWTLSTDPRTPDFTPTSHVFADDLFVAVGPDGAIATSPDAKVWTTARAAVPTDPDLTRIDHLGGRFIATGREGLLLVSADGATWNRIQLPTTANLTGVAHDGTRHVIGTNLAAETEFFVSTNTTDWTRVAAGDHGAVRDITHGDGHFAAVTGRRVVFSTDAADWAAADLPNDEGHAIAHYKGTFVIVGNKASILQSGSVPTTSPAPLTSGLANGAVLTTNDPITVGVTGDAAGSEIVSVDFILDGQLVSRVETGPFTWTGAAGLPGEHRLSIVARDAEGNVSFDHIVFTVDFSPWQQVSPALPIAFLDTVRAPDGSLYGFGSLNISSFINSVIARSRDGLDWRKVHGTSDGQTITQMAVSDQGTLVASASGSSVLSSLDGEHWQPITIPVSGVYLAWGNGVFVAMPGSNPSGAAVSLDGFAWDSVDFGSRIFGANVADLAFHDGRFVLATRAGTIFESTDGIAWTLTTTTPLDIGFATPKFTEGGANLVLLATDIFVHDNVSGWTKLARPAGQTLSKLYHGDGQYLGVNSLGLYVSSDLANWTQTYAMTSESDPQALAAYTRFEGRWLAYYRSSLTPYFATSTDAADWQPHIFVDTSVPQRSTSRGLGGIATDGEQLLAVGAHGLLHRSTDGRIWEQQPYIGPESLSHLVYIDGQWITCGASGALYTSPDGVVWTKRDVGTTKTLYRLFHNGSRFVMYGDGVIFSSMDAVTWTPVTSIGGAAPLKISSGFVTSQGVFTLLTNSRYLYTSADGVTWNSSDIIISPSPTGGRRMVETPDGYLISGGVSSGFGNFIVSSTDLLTWTPEYRAMPEVYLPAAAIENTRLSTQHNGDGDFRFSNDSGATWFTVQNNRGYGNVAAFKGSYYAVSGEMRIDEFSLVDLTPVATAVTTDASPGPGSTVSVEWDVINRGYSNAADGRPIRIEVRLGTNPDNWVDGDILLVDETFTDAIAINAALHFSRDYILPTDIPFGDYHLKIRVDGSEHLSELNESNNTFISDAPAFTIKSWTLNVAQTPGGVVRSGPGSGLGTLSAVRTSASGFVTLGARTFLANRATVDLVAVADKGFGFAGWMEYPAQGFESLSLEMDRDRTVTPLFSPLRNITTTVQGQGTLTVTPDDGVYVDGDPVTIEVTPADGWFFVGWSGSLSGDNPAPSFNITGDVHATATFAPLGLTLQDWRETRFGAEASNHAIAGDLEDPDHDGRPNLLEYVLGSDPLDRDQGPPWQVGLTNNQLTLTYTLDQQAVDATIVVETTATLGSPASWTPDQITVELTEENAQSKTMEARVPLSGNATFLRLRIQHN